MEPCGLLSAPLQLQDPTATSNSKVVWSAARPNIANACPRSLQEAFGSTDEEQICLEILSKGELQVRAGQGLCAVCWGGGAAALRLC